MSAVTGTGTSEIFFLPRPFFELGIIRRTSLRLSCTFQNLFAETKLADTRACNSGCFDQQSKFRALLVCGSDD